MQRYKHLIHRGARPAAGGVLLMLGSLLWATAARAQTPAEVLAHVEGRGERLGTDVAAFYRARGYAPVWNGPEAARRHERIWASLATEAEAHGLDASWAAWLARQPEASAGPPPGGDAARREVALTEAVLRFVAEVTRGRIAPHKLHAGWTATPPSPSNREWLEQLTRAGMLPDALYGLGPDDAAYHALREALAAYRALAARGGWPRLGFDTVLRPGDRGAEVALLRRRLAWPEEGTAPAGVPADSFDASLGRAVRSFQARHGLVVDTVVGAATRAALNVPVAQRLRQLVLSLEHLRWLPNPRPDRYVLVNLAACRLQAYDPGGLRLQMKVIVGTPATPTPLLHGRLEAVVLAPYWNVPASIVRNEIEPEAAQDPGYLARHGYRRTPSGGLRQDPGPGNALGRLKFVFPNAYAIGLHDTPARHLFASPDCALSHGCIRLEQPLALAGFALDDPARWSRAALEAAIATWEPQRVDLPAPLPVYLLYWTAWVNARGQVHFRDDRYGYDERLARALGLP